MLTLSFETELLDGHFNTAINYTPLAHLALLSLDRLIGGIRPGQLLFLSGSPGASKTTLVNQIGDDLAAQGHPVLFFTFEVGASQLVAKSLARLSGDAFTLSDIPGLQNNSERCGALLSALEKYREAIAPNICFLTQFFNTTEIGAYVATCESQTTQKPIVLLDYLQIIKAEEDASFLDERMAIKQAVLGLRRIANLHGVPIIAVSSVNRQNYDTGATSLSALGGCSFIEYSADIVLNLSVAGRNKEERATNLSLEKRPVTITALKNRFGQTGEISLVFDAPHARFEEE
ncbi:replicative DNA helicase [Eggerthella sp. YY7918]|uniref:replicative DNA helicase n=1 Tax=Eggerthella sp. (strain YY7918) TaxID=502558 RepID=UPI0002171295|nr:replicative DNA helicase [Eggerthella sp. YY7918]BAK45825.1 replicative DNA helicase [Eggerthella sp. YY7918]